MTKLNIPLQNFDGIGLARPKDLPKPTPQSLQKLEQLLHENDHKYGLLFPEHRQFHNHNVHALVSAYYLGASPEAIQTVYEQSSTSLVNFEDDEPKEINTHTWFDHLDDKSFIRGYYDFFRSRILVDAGDESQATQHWKPVLHKYLLQHYERNGKQQTLLDGIFGGLTHVVIHLGYATEVNSWEIGAETLALGATGFDTGDLEQVSSPYPYKPPSTKSKHPSDPLKLLDLINKDTRLDTGETQPQTDGSFAVPYLSVLAEYIDALELTEVNVDSVLKKLLYAAVLTVVASHPDKDARNNTQGYSFFLIHLLTSLHEIIEITTLATDIYNDKSNEVTSEKDKKLYRNIPEKQVILPKEYILAVIKNYWVQFVVLYFEQLRPHIDAKRIEIGATALGDKLPGKDDIWNRVHELLFDPSVHEVPEDERERKYPYECHLHKAIRAILFASRYLTTEDEHEDGDGAETHEFGNRYFYGKAAYLMARASKWKLYSSRQESTRHLDIVTRVERLQLG